MSKHLEKAKRALEAAADVDKQIEERWPSSLETKPEATKRRAFLLDCAVVNSHVAKAEALERIAALLERREMVDSAVRGLSIERTLSNAEQSVLHFPPGSTAAPAGGCPSERRKR